MISRNARTPLFWTALLSGLLLLSPPVSAQNSVALTEVTLPPTVRATNPVLRFALLEERVELEPERYDVLCDAAREGATLGASLADSDARKDIFRRSLEYADRARALDPEGIEGRYWLAVASGLLAEEEGGRTKIRLAEQAWDESSWVLSMDANHAGAHHLQGRLHAAVMRLNRVLRFLARTLLGGDVLGQASWDSAVHHLGMAAQLAPHDAVNHLELGMAYKDLERWEEARQAFQTAVSTPPRRVADYRHIEQAKAMLERIPE